MDNDKSVDSKGTELEQIQEKQDVQDAVFSDAFDAAEQLDGESAGADNDDFSRKSKADDSQSSQQHDQGQQAKDDKQAQDDAASKQAQAADSKQSDAASKDNEETYEQRWKSLQGIIKSKDEKFEFEKAQLLTELDGLKKTVATLSAQTDKKDKKGTDKSDSLLDNLTDEEKEALSEYEKDFDSVSKMEGLKRDKALKKLEDKILERLEERTAEIQEKIASRVKPIEETFQEQGKQTHFEVIRKSHSDFETHRDSGAILKWIESKPRYLQAPMLATYEKGEAGDVVELITDFKKESGLLEDNKDEQLRADNLIDMQKKKEEKKQNLSAVITKRGSVDTGKGRADDFESAFDEAVKVNK
jgi:hypothetical protein